jgi:hypothetical protein
MWINNRAKSGDVYNSHGDIMSDNGRVINSGSVFVTEAQAREAKQYGWVITGEFQGLLIIRRSPVRKENQTQ